MTPEIEREYKRLIERAEAYFSARVRWEGDKQSRGLTHIERWLLDLYDLRKREAAQRGGLVRTAGGG